MGSKTKSERLKRLISHGFFAPELPPCFVSNDLSKYRKSILSGINALPPSKGKPNKFSFISEPAWFYYPRFNKNDRRHGTPNPISHLLLAQEIANNYIALRKIAKLSKISASPPVFDWSGPRALVRPSIDLRDDFRIDLSSRREEFVSTDIRAFFHSIYTHSIPWAIYGKEWAKANRGYAHYGNVIDLYCRNSQDGQTLGLPVGPDTSRLLAEIIASAIDSRICVELKLQGRDASRYIDDYTISSPNGVTGEAIIAKLRQETSNFELELSREKTEIIPTSTRQETGWKDAIRAHIPRSQNPTDEEIQRFFYEIGRICSSHPDLNVEKYAYQNARIALLRASNWKKTQNLLINGYRRNPSLIALLVELLLLRQKSENDVDLHLVKEFIESRIKNLTDSNRTGEIIWMIFCAIRLNIVIPSKSLQPLFEISNSFIATLIILANSRGIIEGAIDKSHWNKSLNSDGLRGQMWLYAYETVSSGINSGTSDAFINSDPYFKLLHSKGIRFLDAGSGLQSMSRVLQILRSTNRRMQLIRDDFDDDFEIELEEVGEDNEVDDLWDGEY